MREQAAVSKHDAPFCTRRENKHGGSGAFCFPLLLWLIGPLIRGRKTPLQSRLLVEHLQTGESLRHAIKLRQEK